MNPWRALIVTVSLVGLSLMPLWRNEEPSSAAEEGNKKKASGCGCGR